jgi:hypothetical protein
LVTNSIFSLAWARSSMIGEARNSSRRWMTSTLLANFVRKIASSIAESPPPRRDGTSRREGCVADGAVRDALALQALLGRKPELPRGRARRDDRPSRAILVVADETRERPLREVDARTSSVMNSAPKRSACRRNSPSSRGRGRRPGSRVVLDVACDHQLAAPLEALDHERFQIGARGVQRAV